MTPTLRAELDRIEDFLMGPEGHSLAAVLSALRGPDSNDVELKTRTTTYVRCAAFPRLGYDGGRGGLNVGWSFWREGPLTLDTETPWHRQSHFDSHILGAANVLGIGPFAVETPTSSTEQTPPPAV